MTNVVLERLPALYYILGSLTVAIGVCFLPWVRKVSKPVTFLVTFILLTGPVWNYGAMHWLKVRYSLIDWTGRNPTHLAPQDLPLRYTYAKQFLHPRAYEAYLSGERVPAAKQNLGWSTPSESMMVGDWNDSRVYKTAYLNLRYMALGRAAPLESEYTGLKANLTPVELLCLYKYLRLIDPLERNKYKALYGGAMARAQKRPYSSLHPIPAPDDATLTQDPLQVPALTPMPPEPKLTGPSRTIISTEPPSGLIP